ncbi:MAG TPA: hypothetical protein VGF49_16705 [Candidatus Solibacter sp.]|jgi:hypothetical protein
MSALTDRVLSLRLPEETIRQQLLEIQQAVLANSPDVKDLNFNAIHPRDLRYLFTQYDRRFFNGLCAPAVERRLKFKFSDRMTVSGGITKRIREHSGDVRFEIMIASAMLFDGFREADHRATVGGLECSHRLDALQRIFEHELIHLLEFICWETSDCAKPRFQEISARIFLHRAHTHALMTRRALAAKSGIVRGSLVSFPFEGRQLTGRVARVSKRATVLVEDPAGPRYTDGRHYSKYSVSIASLK